MSNIISSVNYDNLSISALLLLLQQSFVTVPEKKKAVMMSLTKKYFEDKTSFNLYDVILQRINGIFSLSEKMGYLLLVLDRELTDNSDNIPDEYKESFFTVLIAFLSDVEEQGKRVDAEVEWNLSNIPKLLTYLKDLDKLGITSVSKRQRINNLIEKIQEEVEEYNKKQDGVKKEKEVKSLVAVENGMTTAKSIAQVENLKKLKLQKSKLTKGSLCEALATFELFEEEDKKYLIEFMYKKNWTSSVSSVKSIVAYDYFCKHLELCSLSQRYFNPLNILLNSLYRVIALNYTDELENWMAYFEVDTVSDMFDKIENWYMTFEGATEKGWTCVKTSLLSEFISRNSDTFEAHNPLIEYFHQLLLASLKEDLSFFEGYSEPTLLEMVEKVKLKTRLTLKLVSFYPNSLIEEFIESEQSKTLVSYYWEIFSKYNYRLFKYDGDFLDVNTIEIDKSIPVEYLDIIKEFLYIPQKMKLKVEDIKTVYDMFYSNPLDDINNGIYRLLRGYFCQHKDNLNKEFVKELWWKDSNFYAFKSFMSVTAYRGSFTSFTDYALILYKTLEEDLNFARKEDLKNVLKLGIHSNAYWFRTVFYKKFKKECPECSCYLEDFFGDNIEGNEYTVVEFIKVFYDLE